jgi:transposase-like protein
MSNIRKRLTKAFKTKVAVAALKGDKPLSRLASEYGIHASQIKDWKERALEGIEQSFSNKTSKPSDRTEALLYEEIGRLKVENEFLKKKLQC